MPTKWFHRFILIIVSGFFYSFLFFNHAYADHPITLSLREAILLSVRHNPNVEISRLASTLQKFNVYVEEWEFYPHYSFQASGSMQQSNVPGQSSFNLQPGLSWLSPIGTQIAVSSTNESLDHYNPALSLQLMQPLMRGFGKAIVEAALNNAKDTDTITRLMVKETLQNTITSVINAYLDVLSAERTITIDQDALVRAVKSVTETKLFIKAGSKAGNELVTVQANVASAASQLENDKNNLNQARYALLTAIGMDPNSPLVFSDLNITALIKKYALPKREEIQKLVLQNDIQYQVDQITLYGPTKRSLLTAEDNTRWQLNFIANMAAGSGGQNASFNGLLNGVNQSESVGFALQIPIDDQVAKQAVVSAKIALKQAQLALTQEKWSKETEAINNWNLVMSVAHALHFAKDAESLQEKTYNVSYQKYLHGLIDSLELQTAQLQLIHAQQTLLNAEINYVKALVNMDLLMGHTLNTWQIGMR